MERFRLIENANHGCCHEVEMVDSTRIQYDFYESDEKYQRVAEFYDREEAEQIVAVLNKHLAHSADSDL